MGHNTISKSNVQDVLGLTSMQEGMLYHYLQNPESDQYFEQFSYSLKGSFNMSACLSAWKWTIQQNEMLRTIFRWEKINNPVQVILKDRLISFVFHDLVSFQEQEKALIADQLLEKDRMERFDLGEGPLFRIMILKLTEYSHSIVVSNHHILFDGWSNGILMEEFLQAYSSFHAGETPMEVAKPPFKEYVKWLYNQDKSVGVEFWEEYLKGYKYKPLYISNFIKETDVKGTANENYIIPQATMNDIRKVAKDEGVSIGTIFSAAWGILLQKYIDHDDIVFGTTVSGRSSNLPGIERMVGLLMNTVPVRIRLDRSTKVIDLLLDVHHSTKSRQPYETVPLVDIQTVTNQNPTMVLFDTLLVIENYPLNVSVNNGLKLESYKGHSRTNYPLVLAINNFEETELNFVYQQKNFNKTTMELLKERYVGILKRLIVNRDQLIDENFNLTNIEENMNELLGIEFNY
ncbi:condensation domain-containing protein [Metabacillus idriensis]|uniref:condensation domain-containing protein n=1 Tax=Metabacillus idriensis TaxID=324768 RepID=UPI00174E23FC|nr:condensation domain-containing protein [Metabacillus idriensis]